MKTRKEKKSIIVKCIYIHSYEHTRLLPWGMLINLFIFLKLFFFDWSQVGFYGFSTHTA